MFDCISTKCMTNKQKLLASTHEIIPKTDNIIKYIEKAIENLIQCVSSARMQNASSSFRFLFYEFLFTFSLIQLSCFLQYCQNWKSIIFILFARGTMMSAGKLRFVKYKSVIFARNIYPNNANRKVISTQRILDGLCNTRRKSMWAWFRFSSQFFSFSHI